MAKVKSEKEMRAHILSQLRANGCEQAGIDIFRRVDEAMKNASSKEQSDIIALQGMQELDALYTGGASVLSATDVKGVSEEAVKRVLGNK